MNQALSPNLHVLILAAGKGKRMFSALPKVLHPILYRPMLHQLLDTVSCSCLPIKTISLVIGHGREEVQKACAAYSHLQFFIQEEQQGTAHAVSTARTFLEKQIGTLLVLCGDAVLLQQRTLESFFQKHQESKAKLSLLTAFASNPAGYGRILRNEKKEIIAIREEKDCSLAEKQIQEINSGIYCFEIAELLDSLSHVKPKNQQSEYYLTDLVQIFAKKNLSMQSLCLTEGEEEILGINDLVQLEQAEKILQRRRNHELMLQGVQIQNSQTVYIDYQSKIAPNVRIESNCIIVDSQIESHVTCESFSRIFHSKIGSHTVIRQGCYIAKSEIGKSCSIGPYAHLRPESILADNVKLGNFVETKKSKIGPYSKASHLSYIGDAEVGAQVNIGCGFITCNYDGSPNKKKTQIQDGAFIGSDTQAVAPIVIGKNAYVASGTTLTKNVPDDALAIARTRQENKMGYIKHKKNQA